MKRNRKSARPRHGLQAVTLCISTAMVLILLGIVVFSVLTARNTSTYVKENLLVTMTLQDDMTNPEAQQLCSRLKQYPYIKHVDFISKERVLQEQTKALGTDPSEFVGMNPYQGSIEIRLKGDYANNDSLKWITTELKRYPKVGNITYQKGLIEDVNTFLQKISIVLLVLACLLTFVSFSLINNTVRLSIYARRFSIHTMKLVGASWGFIRRPFVWRAVGIGLIAALIAVITLSCFVYMLYTKEPEILTVVTPHVTLVTAASEFFFGIIITAICSSLSVNKFLKMKASELYNI